MKLIYHKQIGLILHAPTKAEFYSAHSDNGTQKAMLHKGYADDKWNYYKCGSRWLIIHPGSGLAVGKAKTLKEAQAIAHSIVCGNMFDSEIITNWCKHFAELVAGAKAVTT